MTGLGAVTPLGADIDTTWSRLLAGESAGSEITAFSSETHPVRIACEAEAFEQQTVICKPGERVTYGQRACLLFLAAPLRNLRCKDEDHYGLKAYE